ncbi:MAG: hypothetical protein IJK54_07935 [Clostridia bacterium]|nr:hypothetical protein [Clostridia bacterium]
MAWEELLKQQTGTEPRKTEQDGGMPPERETLIREICGEMGSAERKDTPENNPEETPAPLSDGYVRRTPVQTYKTAPDYTKRRIGRVVQALIVLTVLGLLVLALFKSGLIRWS